MRAVFVVVALAVAALAAPALNKDLIREINEANVGWTAGVNERFLGMDLEDVKHQMGVLPDSAEKWAELDRIEPAPASYVAADDFDPRVQWPQCKSLSEVRDQSNCGSCWAFGAVEAMTDRYCIASNGTVNFHISAEDMNSCCTSCGMGCNGGYPSAAWQYWVKSGVVTGGNYGQKVGCKDYSLKNCDHHVSGKYGPCPAVGPTPPCPKTCQDGSAFTAAKKFGSKAYGVSGEANIQKELQTNGPVEVAFTVYEDFLTYKSGVYTHKSGSQLGGHAVKMMGWGVDGGVKYWLVANSWNEDWGDNGYFKIKRGTNECGIEGQVVAGTPKL